MLDEINLWRRVDFVDISTKILYQSHMESKEKDERKPGNEAINMNVLLLSIFEYTFLESSSKTDSAFDDDKIVIYIEIGRLFSIEMLKSYKYSYGSEGYKIYSNFNTIQEELNIIRQLESSFKRSKSNKNEQFQTQIVPAKIANEKDKFSCSIKIRNELIFSNLITRNSERDTRSTDMSLKKSVALLVPSNNFKYKTLGVSQCPFVKHLLPTFLKTLTLEESEGLNISIYIGYDVGDPIMESEESIEYIKKQAAPYVQIIPVKIPKTGAWLTFIWNKLFVEAVARGSGYFLQVNDDVEFLSEGWLSKSIEEIDRLEVGVVGLQDSKWNCKLYTQTLVNINHYKIFKGHFFPTQLKDWYSDNWISSVYGINGVCMKEGTALVRNGQVNTRYSACDDRNYPSSVRQGRDMIINALEHLVVSNVSVIQNDDDQIM